MKKSIMTFIFLSFVSVALAQTDQDIIKALKEEGYSQAEIDQVVADRYVDTEGKDQDNSLSRTPSKDRVPKAHIKRATKKAVSTR